MGVLAHQGGDSIPAPPEREDLSQLVDTIASMGNSMR
jgi:hypothetical protein